ncbi:MAG: NAD(P)/FAD-dependent oxidoreductase [Pseudomonadota bacterium]
MLDGQDTDAHNLVQNWLDRFATARDTGDVRQLFAEDCHWRDLVALTGEIGTISGPEGPDHLAKCLTAANAARMTLHPNMVAPQQASRAGVDVIEAAIAFDTDKASCTGILRLHPDGRAWTLSTAIDALRVPERPPEPAYAKDVRAPNWLDNRDAERAFADRDPAVLVVGGGHAGLTIAARMREHGIDTLVVDREKRIGDNWRLRYHNLKLHNQIGVNHMPYLPFPKTWPRYIPKDMIANWLEAYVEIMEINFWTETNFDGADWDEANQRWNARLTLADGSTREMHPHHIVMAASVSAVKKLPDIPSLANFEGITVHSSEFEIGSEWTNKPVMVLGTGTSSHDISQHLHAHGAKVTMVQRSPTMVVNVEPSAQLYDGLYLGDWDTGPTLDERDLLNASFALDLIKRSHQILTDEVKQIDRETLEGLERAGFELDYGEDNTGWPMKYRTRGGGYYFNIGCSELIIDGEIDLIQHRDIDAYTPTGVRMKDGTERPAELVVMATGYEGQGALIRQWFGQEISDRAGQVWGFREDGEMANMWTRTGQPGLWFTAGAFSQCRIYSKYLGFQIALDEMARR